MIPTTSAFGDFERTGWEDAATASTYDEHLAPVTAQSLVALLEDAGIRAGLRCSTWPVAAASSPRARPAAART